MGPAGWDPQPIVTLEEKPRDRIGRQVRGRLKNVADSSPLHIKFSLSNPSQGGFSQGGFPPGSANSDSEQYPWKEFDFYECSDVPQPGPIVTFSAIWQVDKEIQVLKTGGGETNLGEIQCTVEVTCSGIPLCVSGDSQDYYEGLKRIRQGRV
ncbi:hypothetical protein M427DRAFT_156223 [Gonapodya prolifera JEL478]|uniref:Uncharacterized protein n=1 Tax=Gonapodya prolifera (strain JEL478) TaxID=1344416 RepID=A0A139AB05_GONPJ|nr:hypothetical protein M427DRAFT_156223 [Gonapodya prolifera JEL478]|eukprot:KXS13986.1 hypothetical protein M427DRAFT_156223 [Gonapodya prolifera JEL478]